MSLDYPFGPGVTPVSTHPAGLLAVNKPSGIKSHPNKPGKDQKSLFWASYDEKREAYRLSGGEWLYLLHRLDSPTSGLILLATNESFAQKIRVLWRDGKVDKTYQARVFGQPQQKEGLWTDKLSKEKRGNEVRAQSGSGLPAITRMRLLDSGTQPMPYSNLSLHPQTGRTHQLRIQSANRKIPIIGDATYGDFTKNREWQEVTGNKRLYLHCRKISFTHPATGKWVASATLPADW